MPNVDSNVTLLLIAFFNLLTAWLAWKTHKATKLTQANVQKIETATNSMKDALVKATGEASHAAGVVEGRMASERKATTSARNRRAKEK